MLLRSRAALFRVGRGVEGSGLERHQAARSSDALREVKARESIIVAVCRRMRAMRVLAAGRHAESHTMLWVGGGAPMCRR